MAIQTGLITLRGKSGNQINYKRNGKYYTKTASKNIRRTEGSKKSSAEFGEASKVASLVNTGFIPLRKNISDGNFIYRLNSAVQKAVKAGPKELSDPRKFADGNISLVEAIQFNRYKKLENLIAVFPKIVIEPLELLTISFPEISNIFSVKPANDTNGIIEMRICSFDFKKGNGKFLQPNELEFPLSEKVFPGATLEIPLDDVKNKLIMVALAVYFTGDNGSLTRDRRYYGGKIIRTFNIKDGKVVDFIAPETVIEKIPEKENRITWKLHTKPEHFPFP
jgi:hypothetical protein